ncbi:MAG: hypothetical protein PHX38_11135 [Sulfuricella sp.]|nr:hypothetical protein [Sulfuricella sp.]
MNRLHLRRLSLFLVLAASLAAAFWVRGEDDDSAEAVAAPARVQERSAEPSVPQIPSLALDRLGRRMPADTDIDPFPAKGWYVPPPPPPPAPPPKPTAPPLPFQFVGKFEDTAGGKPVIYLAKGNESFAVSPGDKFDDVYQFEAIERGQMLIVYLPLSIKQRLPLGVPE